MGAGCEVGRSAFLIDERILLDYGIKPSDPPQYPQGEPEAGDGRNLPRPPGPLWRHTEPDGPGADRACHAADEASHELLAEDTMEIAEGNGTIAPFDPVDMHLLMRMDEGTGLPGCLRDGRLYDHAARRRPHSRQRADLPRERRQDAALHGRHQEQRHPPVERVPRSTTPRRTR